LVVFALACSLLTPTPSNNPPAFDSTKAALEIQNTAAALQLPITCSVKGWKESRPRFHPRECLSLAVF
jgi:hypothetical protein